MDYTVLNRDELPREGHTFEFEGVHQDTAVSFISVDMPPGGMVRLHKHPYQEIFIIQEGVSTFTVGATTFEAPAGQIIPISADVPHKFANMTDKRLKQIDFHVSTQFVTHWLED